MQFWSTANTSNIEILERFQSKAFYMLVEGIRKDFQTPTVKVEILRYRSQYGACLSEHPNDLTVNLMEQPNNNRQLRRHLPNDLPTIFLV
jgi:hypothetical protein